MGKKCWDVVIAGAGPAGLSAALILGRASRRVLLCDTGTPRSWASKAMHGFLSRDGIKPAQFRRIAHRELARYSSVCFRQVEVSGAVRLSGGTFEVRLGRGRSVRSRKLLIATGVFDRLPPFKGIEQFFGRSVFQCPYCDGWEVRGKPVAVYGRQRRGFEMARAITAWTRDIVLCTDGTCHLPVEDRRYLSRNGIEIAEQRILGLQGRAGALERILFKDGSSIRRSALFFDTPARGQSKLAESVGCRFAHHGGIKCGQYEATSVPGVFVAGNIIKDVQLAIIAAAEGTRAAFGINRALTREDFERRATGTRRIEHPKNIDPEMQRRRAK